MSGVVILETLRRHASNPVVVLFGVIIAGVGAMVGALDGQAGVWHAFTVLFTILIGSQLIGPEFSSGTLQLILARPINRSVYLISRVAGVVLVIWILIWLTSALDAGGRFLIAGKQPEGALLLASCVGLSLLAFNVCCILALFGSFTRSHYNLGLYFVLQAFLALLISTVSLVMAGAFRRLEAVSEFLKSHPIVLRTLQAIKLNLFPELPHGLTRSWTLLVVANAVLALLVACLIFRRREVPYGAD